MYWESMTSELWVQQVVQQPKSVVFLSSPSGLANSSHQLHQLLDAKYPTGLAAWPPACSFCRLSLLWRYQMVPKEIGDGRTNRRNQSIPSKKLLAGQDSCPVWTKRRDSRSHEMPRSCHTGHSAICIPMRCPHVDTSALAPAPEFQNFRGIQGTKVLRWSAFSVVDILTNQSTRFEFLQLKLILP